MNYEEAVIEFLAEKENLPLALEIAEKIDEVKNKLHKDFWIGLDETLRKRLTASAKWDGWHFTRTEDGALCKDWAYCSIGPFQEGNHLNFSVQQEYNKGSGVFQLFYGIGWAEKLESKIELNGLTRIEERLNTLGFRTDGWTWWIGWKYIDCYPRRKDFLIKMAENKSIVIEDVAQLFWKFIEDYCQAVEDANRSLCNI